ncbi:unnamed protein product [Victoria cruziana]
MANLADRNPETAATAHSLDLYSKADEAERKMLPVTRTFRSAFTFSRLLLLLLFLLLLTAKRCQQQDLSRTGPRGRPSYASANRKLLVTTAEQGVEVEVVRKPNRIGEACSREDIALHQGATAPLPNGIPTYTVQILNVCVTGCNISAIHVSCGWFSTARTINPRLFRRLHYDDCLVNDGKAVPAGASLSFQYANTRPYLLTVSSVLCHP